MGGDLIQQLPPVRGRLIEHAPLGPVTWFRVGGAAELLFQPADAEDLAQFLRALPPEVPVTAIGVASNLLVRDGGIAGVTVRLFPGFSHCDPVGPSGLRAGAGALDRNVAREAAQAGIAGLEFLSGIPGTVGGGFRTNAGAYGREFKDALALVDIVDRGGRQRAVAAAEFGLSYRHAEFPADWIVTGATFAGSPDDPAAITRRIGSIRAAREASQPIRERTGGSTFANPPGCKAWELIDAAGCRGLVRGGAMVSEKHANFLINTGDATAADLEALGEEVRRRVHDRFGILLEWEIRRIGQAQAATATGDAGALARAG